MVRRHGESVWDDMPQEKDVNDGTNGEKYELRDKKSPSPLPIRATVCSHIFNLLWSILLLRAIAGDLCGKYWLILAQDSDRERQTAACQTDNEIRCATELLYRAILPPLEGIIAHSKRECRLTIG
jgi:hypothetical protein